MPLSPSWKTHFLKGLAPLNTIGDHNMTRYSEAMTHNAAMDSKIKYLTMGHNFILLTNNQRKVNILHNIKNFSGIIL